MTKYKYAGDPPETFPHRMMYLSGNDPELNAQLQPILDSFLDEIEDAGLTVWVQRGSDTCSHLVEICYPNQWEIFAPLWEQCANRLNEAYKGKPSA